MEREFLYDIVLESQDICNMTKELAALKEACESGRRIVLYGLRNAGKTSLVKSLLIPWFRKSRKNAITVYADFMGVDTLEDIAMRLRSAFERAYAQAFPLKGNARQFLAGFLKLKPVLSSSSGDSIELSVTSRAGDPPGLEEIIAELGHLSKKSPVLIVFDEFQDVAGVSKAEALFRSALQSIPHRVPVVIMGSKKHLLSNIFSKTKAPLHNWGEDLEIGPLPYNEYCVYMNERFERFGLSISLATSKTLQDMLHRNPESINIVCRGLIELHCGKRKTIDETLVEPAMLRAVERRGRRYEEFFSRFSPSEQRFLIALSKGPGVKQPQGKDFVAALGVSTAAVRKALHYLEDEAIIDKTGNGYRVTDPLLACYLKHFR